MWLQFGFVIFWKKDFGAKAAHKMLVKLTPVGIAGVYQSEVIEGTSSPTLCNMGTDKMAIRYSAFCVMAKK